MGYLSDPQKLISKRFTANGSMTQKDLAQWNRAIIGSAGVRLKIVQADSGNYKMGKNVCVKNESSGWGSVWRANAFGTSDDTMLVGPRDEIELECVDLQSSATYRWDRKGRKRPSAVTQSTPTPSWTGGPPTVTTNYMWSSVITNGQAQGLFFHGKIVISDGGGATAVTLPLPSGVLPGKLALKVPIDARIKVDTTWTDLIGYIDLNSDTGATRRTISFAGTPTLTDDKACEILYSGFVPIAGWEAFTPKLSYATATPGSAAELGYMMLLGENTYAMIVSTQSSDSNACSGVTLVPPLIPPDMDLLGSCKAIEVAGAGGATYSNPDPSVNMTHATEESRTITNLEFTTATDGQNLHWFCSAIMPINNWQAWTPSATYTTGTPATNLGYTGDFDAYDNMVFISGHLTFDDGNGCTAVVATGLPVPPRALCTKIAIPSTQVQHTDTFVNPMVFLDSDDTDPDDRAVEQDNLTTFDDAEVGELQFTGFYFV